MTFITRNKAEMTVRLWPLGCQMTILCGSLAFLEILRAETLTTPCPGFQDVCGGDSVERAWGREQLCLQPREAETVYPCRAKGQARLFPITGDSGS